MDIWEKGFPGSGSGSAKTLRQELCSVFDGGKTNAVEAGQAGESSNI